jgi:hypothetical protein
MYLPRVVPFARSYNTPGPAKNMSMVFLQAIIVIDGEQANLSDRCYFLLTDETEWA